MKNHLNKLPYLIFYFLLCTLLPIFVYFMANKTTLIITTLLIFLPLASYLVSFRFSYTNEDFSYIFSLAIGVSYFITCIILLNFHIVIYDLLYIFLSLCGQGCGFLACKIFKKNK